MKFVCVLSCLSLLLAAAAAGYPYPCASPPLLTGGISLVADGQSLAGTLIYDAYGQKVRVKTEGFAGNGTFSLEQLLLFHEEVYFEIDWKKFSCRKKKLDSGFSPLQVDPEAKPTGQVILGSSSSSGMGVLVSSWQGELPGNGTYFTNFSEIGCIPITYAAFGPEFGFTFLSTYNWVIGIFNPNDLQIPPICAFAQMEKSGKPDTFFSALASLARQTARSD
ncbi:ependymin-2-like [Salarias fasciatus]|uniref:ependymin-2-like n=1 Tax=Salarias fasciatus TaxID=181472 RepID=UPI001176F1C0|nr:ependymin-2-like [Salarias fasciatus]